MNITPSQIIEYLYCPRFTWFEYVLAIPQFEERLYKVKRGRNIHENKLKQNIEYLRKKIGVKEKWTDQYLSNNFIRGKVDEVLLLENGTMAPLDYKFAQYNNKIYSTYKTQMFCYAWLIEENFNKPVEKGFLVYTRSKNKLVSIDVSEQDKHTVKKCANEILQIINENLYPKPTKIKKRCLTCTYQNICTK